VADARIEYRYFDKMQYRIRPVFNIMSSMSKVSNIKFIFLLYILEVLSIAFGLFSLFLHIILFFKVVMHLIH